MSTQLKGETAAWFSVILFDETASGIVWWEKKFFDILKEAWMMIFYHIELTCNQRHEELLYHEDIVYKL